MFKFRHPNSFEIRSLFLSFWIFSSASCPQLPCQVGAAYFLCRQCRFHHMASIDESRPQAHRAVPGTMEAPTNAGPPSYGWHHAPGSVFLTFSINSRTILCDGPFAFSLGKSTFNTYWSIYFITFLLLILLHKGKLPPSKFSFKSQSSSKVIVRHAQWPWNFRNIRIIREGINPIHDFIPSYHLYTINYMWAPKANFYNFLDNMGPHFWQVGSPGLSPCWQVTSEHYALSPIVKLTCDIFTSSLFSQNFDFKFKVNHLSFCLPWQNYINNFKCHS